MEMKILIWILAVIFGLGMTYLLMAEKLAHAEEAPMYIKGVVSGITDGDTLTVRDEVGKEYEIRLFAIDAPETSCHYKNPAADDYCTDQAQPYGKSAKQYLTKLVYGKQVIVRLGQGASYNRLIGTIFIGDMDVNLQMIKEGYAWHEIHYAKFQPENERLVYSSAEYAAREGKGLWEDPKPISPWQYRHNLNKVGE